jgi:hypothetical protein
MSILSRRAGQGTEDDAEARGEAGGEQLESWYQKRGWWRSR